MEQKELLRSVKRSVVQRFNLRHDQAEEEEVIDSITRNSDFVGANLWTLIFAILIASIGLNMNSTAVIIGAMLISPLMGPIMGVGLGIGTDDFSLVKKGVRNLLIATAISIGTSTVYFLITPIDLAQSELLARTTPSLWDVFIAFFGGLAGVVAATRKEKSNAIPGVAIATALMPPLCTAGFGIATANYYYFFGAMYLYCINSIFICISTFLIIRLMKFRRKTFVAEGQRKRIPRYILLTIVVTVLPSIYLTYGIVNKSLFENAARQFVDEQFRFDNTLVVSKTFRYDGERAQINVLLIGRQLPERIIDSIRKNLPAYDLGEVRLVVRQGLNAGQELDFEQIRASILEDVTARDSLRNPAIVRPKPVLQSQDLLNELKALHPDLVSYSATKTVEQHVKGKPDTLMLVLVDLSKPLKAAQRESLRKWIQTRMKADSVKLVIE